jgi:transcriptional regulator with XRE-family HTH domain
LEIGDVNRIGETHMVDRTPLLHSADPGSIADEDRDEAAFRAKLASIAKANREAAGLSPGEAARRAHLSRAAVCDVEGRKGWPRVDTLVAYARAVGTTPWALLHRAHAEVDGQVDGQAPLEPESALPPHLPIDLNAILLAAGASEQTWRTAKALLEALVAADS